MISSVANPTVRRVRRLRKRRWRDKKGLILAEGHRVVRAALDAGAQVDHVLHAPRATVARAALLEEVRAAGARVTEVAPPVMAALTSVETPPDLVAVVGMPRRSLAAIGEGASGLLLSSIHDPRTLGAIIAAGVATGGTFAIVVRGCAEVFEPKVVRAAAGAHFHAAVVPEASLEDALSHLRARRITPVGVGPAGVAPWHATLREPIAFHVDGDGGAAGDQIVWPPASGPVEPSLAARTAAVLYEWVRQRDGAA